ncbi:MAG TPA: hypothetical protein VFX16_17100 [Pseudonocardiaceae bacterium]|nr:hypothetical protein [Pseudonocardiaceae bacterium]
MSRIAKTAGVLLIPLAVAVTPLTATSAAADGGSAVFITSAHENGDLTVTLPLHVGTSNGQTVYYIVTDTDSGATAQQSGLNKSQKLANAVRTGAVQHVSVAADGTVDFPATVNFAAQQRVVTPGPQGFPPAAAQSTAVGDPGYSPLIQLPDGTIENAPQIANSTGRANKVVGIDLVHHTVTYQETRGFQGGKAVHYISTDASDPVAAALENVTFAPALNNARSVNDDSTASARASLAAFTNGRTGVGNEQRQGLNSAILDGQDPLNVLAWNPNQGRYSPLWDVHLTQWSATAVADHQNVRQTDFGQVQNLAAKGTVAGFDGTVAGTAFGASGFIVDCPLVAFGS